MSAPEWLAKALADDHGIFNGTNGAVTCACNPLPWITFEEYAAHVAAVLWAEFTARAQQAREDVARSVRGTVRVGPFGPNSLAGGSVSLTPDEARDAADAAVAALLTAMGGDQ